jgi:hypothetical protein
MPKFNQIEAEVKGWATGHLLFTGVICIAVGIVIGLLLRSF